MRTPLIYHNRPTLGLDIGSRTAKLVQLEKHGKNTRVVGYGYAAFPADSITEGIISDPEAIALSIKSLMAKPTAGRLTAKRAAISVPVAKVFTRILQLPPMNESDLAQAVSFEAEQYVPVPINDLYIDYEVIPTAKKPLKPASSVNDKNEAIKTEEIHTDVVMVAAPRAIIDSYIKLFDLLNMEVSSIETSLTAITRAMISANQPRRAELVVDFGSRSTDLSVYDEATRITGSFAVGGDDLTQTLVKTLAISLDQANEIKYKFGIGESGLQTKIKDALAPQLKMVTDELKKAIKYYQDRSEEQKQIDTLVLTGGSSRMPGFVDFLYNEIKIPIILGDPWQRLNVKPLPEASKLEGAMYTTAIGLAQRGLL